MWFAYIDYIVSRGTPVFELDLSLRRLASLPVPADLDLMDEAVIAGLAKYRSENRAGRRATGYAGAIALLLGLANGALLTGQPVRAQPTSPFAPDNPLAPSTLLDVHP